MMPRFGLARPTIWKLRIAKVVTFDVAEPPQVKPFGRAAVEVVAVSAHEL